MIFVKADEVTEDLFESLLARYHIGLGASMKGSDFIFDYVDLFYYKCHRIMPNVCGESYIHSPI